MRSGSENKFERELNQAFRRGHTSLNRSRDCAESAIPCPRRRAVKTRCRHREIRMIKQIEELRPELDAHALRDLCSFEDGEVEVIDPGAAEICVNARLVAWSEIGWGSEAGSIEPLGKASPAGLLIASGNYVRPNIRNAKVGALQSSRTGITDFEWEATLEGGDAVDAPARYSTIGDSS